jgi:hypothetical protein
MLHWVREWGITGTQIIDFENLTFIIIVIFNSQIFTNKSANSNLKAESNIQNINIIKSYIFWDITSCSSLKVNRRFGGISLLTTCFHAGFLLGFFFETEDGYSMLLRTAG